MVIQMLAWLAGPRAIDTMSLCHCLLYETHIRCGTPAFGHFLNRAELHLVTIDVFSQRSPDALGMARTHNHALQELPLGAVRENIDEVQREFLKIVMNHHQIAVFALQLLLVSFDLDLALHRLLLIHDFASPIRRLHAVKLTHVTTQIALMPL